MMGLKDLWMAKALVRSGGVRALQWPERLTAQNLLRGLTGLATISALYPFLLESLYKNYFFASSILLFFTAWVVSNWLGGRFDRSSAEGQRQRKVLIGMIMTLTLGLATLLVYEIKMPKYHVALVNKELYRVPPQLSKRQLIELGAECNTYGNTLCSHDVFAKIVKQDPRDFNALANLAMAQSHLGFHKEAVINFKRAVDNGIQTYDVLRFYGNSLKAVGQTELAKQAYEKSLGLNPNQKVLKERLAELEF